jgi:6-pyruvoyltetrahydropterin/6-carboxytetrahydropterin synthase
VYRISKTFSFDAAHRLDGLPMGHKCGRLHGHTYEVELFLESPKLDSVGFVRDYGELSQFKEWLMNTFDHHMINEVVPQPTAENMAQFIYNRAVALYHEVVAVRVSETGNTTALFAPHSLPPIDTILDAFESLAAEPPLTSPERQRLARALYTLWQGSGSPAGANQAHFQGDGRGNRW